MNSTEKKIKISVMKPSKKYYLCTTLFFTILFFALIYCATTWWNFRNFFKYNDLSDYPTSANGTGQHFTADIDVWQFLTNPNFGGDAFSSYTAGVDTNNSFHTTLYCYCFYYENHVYAYYIPQKKVKDFEQQLAKGPGNTIHISGIQLNTKLKSFYSWLNEGPHRIDGKDLGASSFMPLPLINAAPLDFFLKIFSTLACIIFDIIFYIQIHKYFPKEEEHILEFPTDAFMLQEYTEYKDCSLSVLHEREGDIRNTKKELEQEFKKIQNKCRDSIYFILIAGFFLLIFRHSFFVIPLLISILMFIRRAFRLWINTYNGTYQKWKRKFQPYPYEELISNCEINLTQFEEIVDQTIKASQRKYTGF